MVALLLESKGQALIVSPVKLVDYLSIIYERYLAWQYFKANPITYSEQTSRNGFPIDHYGEGQKELIKLAKAEQAKDYVDAVATYHAEVYDAAMDTCNLGIPGIANLIKGYVEIPEPSPDWQKGQSIYAKQ